MSANTLLNSLAIGGYKSFGSLQEFNSFSKINLIIGQNNVGKSNVFKFLTKVYPFLAQEGKLALEQADRHFPNARKFEAGFLIDERLLKEELKQKINKNHDYVERLIDALFAKLNESPTWIYFDERGAHTKTEKILEVLEQFSDHEIQNLWMGLTNYQGGGSRQNDWLPPVFKSLLTRPNLHKVEFIPAIREVNSQGSNRSQFSGERLIDEIAKLQSPSAHEQELKNKFEQINKFLQEVTTNPTARIEIPYSRDTINVLMNNRVLPLEALGSGIQEIVIIAAAATTIENSIVCVEEPELHLNPILQKRLVRYLEKHTDNQYFISTHSASLMDTPNAEIYHISLVNDESIVERVTSDKKRTEICADLGYHPSDLLQSNCVIWVEGPSDRVYLNYWIKAFDCNLLEGVHYSIMFYGGKLLSHLTGEQEETVNEFISLRRLNRQSTIVIDSDRKQSGAQINKTKKRVEKGFEDDHGFAWVTQGTEIENYLPIDKLKAAIKNVSPKAILMSGFSQYDNNLKITLSEAVTQASKVEVAKRFVADNPLINADDVEDILDLKPKIKQLIQFIKNANKNA